jgi:hypothetical protein
MLTKNPVAMAGGLALGLGLHVIGLQALSDLSYTPLQEERETRMRTFWAFFLFDRLVLYLHFHSILSAANHVEWLPPSWDVIVLFHGVVSTSPT